MPAALGRHAPRLTALRALNTVKGRREQKRFVFEGPTLLDEAVRAGVSVEALYVTQRAYEEFAPVRALADAGTPVYTVDERTAAALSSVETPSGILAVAPIRQPSLRQVLARAGLIVVLAGINDPGNAGTLLRSAEAFGAAGVLFGVSGVDPYHPKVVRAAMGSLFRLPVAVSDAAALPAEAASEGIVVVGLAPGGMRLETLQWPPRCALVVGNERRGLGAWAGACAQLVEVPMIGPVESLNAAVAGSIALYESARNRA